MAKCPICGDEDDGPACSCGRPCGPLAGADFGDDDDDFGEDDFEDIGPALCLECAGTGDCPMCGGDGDGVNFNCDWCGNSEACPNCMGNGYMC